VLERQPESVEDWLKLAAQHERVVLTFQSNPDMAAVVWSSAGFIVECLLKAAIHRKERFNRWPTDRKALNTHDLQRLITYLGVEITPSHEIAPDWAVVVQWRRGHMYNPSEFSKATIAGLVEAVLGEKGVAEWIRQNCLTHS